jgi:hypothetical protein
MTLSEGQRVPLSRILTPVLVDSIGRNEILLTPEIQRRRDVGVVCLIIGLDDSRNGKNALDPLIATIIEAESKTSTLKQAGQLSIPGETRKQGEDQVTNVIAALLEFADDSKVEEIKRNLFFVEGASYFPNLLPIGNLDVDLAILVFNGPLSIRFNPKATDVRGNGWLTKSEIEEVDRCMRRNTLTTAIDVASNKDLIGYAIRKFELDRGARIPVAEFLSEEFTFSSFDARRELLDDVLDKSAS